MHSQKIAREQAAESLIMTKFLRLLSMISSDFCGGLYESLLMFFCARDTGM